MRINHAILIHALPTDRLEDFVNDRLAQRYKDDHSHELWRGAGNVGRDVTAYVADKPTKGPWDNFRCKQLSKTLPESAAFVGAGKIFMHSAAGE
ncbi:hypothetical protein [Mesorhizobium sp. LjRoot246]|uniref:hypothetical protein n=1 Tax=Mesorhizobium sp. LjRoot246 TaxID=3342294 RepID=UPI003ECFA991